jgi:predicted transglutaminase-like cysteine proteinase
MKLCRWPLRALPGAGRPAASAAAGALLLALSLALSLAAPARSADEAGHNIGLFGYLEFASGELAALPLWRDALARIAGERRRIGECEAEVSRCGSVPLTVWRAKVSELQTLGALQRLIEVNRYVNAFPRRAEDAALAAVERWASPLEFLERGGTAKDFAVMKFATLRDAGVANEAMRIVVVYDALNHRRHAVLAVALEEATYILDNVANAVQPADKVRFYVPYYSVNETTRWAHVVRRPGPTSG